MIHASETVTLEEQLQADMDEQFAEMDYTLTCDQCGENVSRLIIADDFERAGLVTSMADRIKKHNMTHYTKPTIYDCQDDDIFGVTHSTCNHR
jgi:hypothetical protein